MPTAEPKMDKLTLHEALALVAAFPPGTTASRPGGPTVRLSQGIAEQQIHRYVVDGEPTYDGDTGVRAFDATEEDLWAPATAPTPSSKKDSDDDTPVANPKKKLRADWTVTKRDTSRKAQSAKPAEPTKTQDPKAPPATR